MKIFSIKTKLKSLSTLICYLSDPLQIYTTSLRHHAAFLTFLALVACSWFYIETTVQ